MFSVLKRCNFEIINYQLFLNKIFIEIMFIIVYLLKFSFSDRTTQNNF